MRYLLLFACLCCTSPVAAQPLGGPDFEGHRLNYTAALQCAVDYITHVTLRCGNLTGSTGTGIPALIMDVHFLIEGQTSVTSCGIQVQDVLWNSGNCPADDHLGRIYCQVLSGSQTYNVRFTALRRLAVVNGNSYPASVFGVAEFIHRGGEITAVFPDGSITPHLWVRSGPGSYGHPSTLCEDLRDQYGYQNLQEIADLLRDQIIAQTVTIRPIAGHPYLPAEPYRFWNLQGNHQGGTNYYHRLFGGHALVPGGPPPGWMQPEPIGSFVDVYGRRVRANLERCQYALHYGEDFTYQAWANLYTYPACSTCALCDVNPEFEPVLPDDEFVWHPGRGWTIAKGPFDPTDVINIRNWAWQYLSGQRSLFEGLWPSDDLPDSPTFELIVPWSPGTDFTFEFASSGDLPDTYDSSLSSLVVSFRALFRVLFIVALFTWFVMALYRLMRS